MTSEANYLFFACNTMGAGKVIALSPAVFGVLTGSFERPCDGASPIRHLVVMPRAMPRSLPFAGFLSFPVLALAAAPALPAVPAQLAVRQYFRQSASPQQPSNVGPQRQDPDAEEVPDIPQGRILPAPIRPPPGGERWRRPVEVQAQPLAPPPGTPAFSPRRPGAAPTKATAPFFHAPLFTRSAPAYLRRRARPRQRGQRRGAARR